MSDEIASENPGQGVDTFEATGDQQEAILARLSPNDRAHYESLLQKYREGKTSKWQEDKLRKVGLIVSKSLEETSNAEHRTQNIEGENSEIALPSYAESATDLARLLDAYFRERISINIKPTLVGQWRKGLKVGEVFVDGKKVIPPSLPKNKSGNRFEVQPCIEWVEKWIVPQWGVADKSTGVVAMPGTAAHYDDLKKGYELRRLQRDEDIANGKFKSVEVFNQHLTAFGLAVNRALNEGEKALKKRILDELETLTAESAKKELIDDAIGRGVRAAIDALRAGVAKAVTEAQEPEGLHELH